MAGCLPKYGCRLKIVLRMMAIYGGVNVVSGAWYVNHSVKVVLVAMLLTLWYLITMEWAAYLRPWAFLSGPECGQWALIMNFLLIPHRIEDENMEIPHQPQVVVCGPPGTEPKHGLSRTRFDREESLVYSRTSTSLVCDPSPLQQYVIPPKDTPKETVAVDVCVGYHGTMPTLRCTRARTKLFKKATKRVSDSESESDSITSEELSSASDSTESEDEFGARLTESLKRMNRSKRVQPSQVNPRSTKALPVKVCTCSHYTML